MSLKKNFNDFLNDEKPVKKIRLTPAQKKALDAYKFAVQQEDRYLGSVFVNSIGQKQHREKVHIAYENAKEVLPVELHIKYL